jgi:hypothetical protein
MKDPTVRHAAVGIRSRRRSAIPTDDEIDAEKIADK